MNSINNEIQMHSNSYKSRLEDHPNQGKIEKEMHVSVTYDNFQNSQKILYFLSNFFESYGFTSCLFQDRFKITI